MYEKSEDLKKVSVEGEAQARVGFSEIRFGGEFKDNNCRVLSATSILVVFQMSNRMEGYGMGLHYVNDCSHEPSIHVLPAQWLLLRN